MVKFKIFCCYAICVKTIVTDGQTEHDVLPIVDPLIFLKVAILPALRLMIPDQIFLSSLGAA